MHACMCMHMQVVGCMLANCETAFCRGRIGEHIGASWGQSVLGIITNLPFQNDLKMARILRVVGLNILIITK